MPSCDVKISALSNGLTVLTERMENVRSVAMGIWLKSGARHDPVHLNGLSHFVEHMVFKGTRSRSAERISYDADSIGGSLNAYTAPDMVSFYATVLDEKTEPAIELLSDLVKNPIFDPEEIENERGPIIEESKEAEDDPSYVCQQAFMRCLWQQSPFTLPLVGTSETLSTFTQDTLFAYAAERFVGENLIFVAAGNVRHEDIVQLAERYLGCIPKGEPLREGAIPAPSTGVEMIEKPTKQVQTLLGYPAPPVSDTQYFVAHLAAMLLGGGMSSRLYQIVRAQNGLVYSINADYMPFHKVGHFSIYAGTSRKNVDKMLALTFREIERLKSELASEQELNRLKDQLISNQILGLESSSSRASSLAGQYLGVGRPVGVYERADRIRSVTAEQIMCFARSTLDHTRLAASFVGDVAGIDLSSHVSANHRSATA